jgi:hypothetical protein
MHDVHDHFLSQLRQLVQTTSVNVIAQRLKVQKTLCEWVESQAPQHFASLANKVHWLLSGSPPVQCAHGSLKKWVAKTNQLGFCGNARHCQCFRDQITEQNRLKDMTQVVTKRVQTWQAKYGVDNPSQCVDIRHKRQTTMAARNYDAIYQKLKQHKQQQGFDQVLARLSGVVTPEFDFAHYRGSFRKNFYDWRCCVCSEVFQDHVDYGRVPRCPTCNPKHTSTSQAEIEQFLLSHCIPFCSRNRSVLNGRELDIWMPDRKLAIEFNGVYWHSDQFRDRNYHANKFLDCRSQGVRLIQIWEDEWKTKQAIVINRLRSVLGIDTRIFARQCELDLAVDPKEYREFLQTHHLQGYASASVLVGLRHQSQLVAVMSFAASRYTAAPWELIRYASAGTVVGGASRLFRTFVRQHRPTSVVSYANRCWSWGGMYAQLGFTETTVKQLNAGYWYVKNDQRYHRSTFTKKALIKQGLDASQTEMQLMKSQGYLVIWDAGNSRWTWTAT